MSGGVSCKCPQAHRGTKPGLSGKVWRKVYWRVAQRFSNRSAFSGYRRTPSVYSGVVCLRCRGAWRTKAAYVDDLKDAGRAVWNPESMEYVS